MGSWTLIRYPRRRPPNPGQRPVGPARARGPSRSRQSWSIATHLRTGAGASRIAPVTGHFPGRVLRDAGRSGQRRRARQAAGCSGRGSSTGHRSRSHRDRSATPLTAAHQSRSARCPGGALLRAFRSSRVWRSGGASCSSCFLRKERSVGCPLDTSYSSYSVQCERQEPRGTRSVRHRNRWRAGGLACGAPKSVHLDESEHIPQAVSPSALG